MTPLARWPLAVVASVLLSGCASAPERESGTRAAPAVEIGGVVIRNELPYGVTDVWVEVPATGAFAGCGNLLPRSSCSNRFQQTAYQGNGILIRWRERGEPHQTDEFVVETPAGTAAGGVYAVEVVIFAPGQAGARMEPATEDTFRVR